MKAKVQTTMKMSLRCKMTSTTTPCTTTWSHITTQEEVQPAILKHPHNNNKFIKTASNHSMAIKCPFSSSKTSHNSHINKWLKISHRSVERLPSLMARLSTQRLVPMVPRWSAHHTPPTTTWSSRVLGRPQGNTMTKATWLACEAVIWAG